MQMAQGVVEQRLVALFAGGCLLFNFPLLALWDRDVTVLGVPLFPLALFLIWALLIAAWPGLLSGPTTAALRRPPVPWPKPPGTACPRD
jgi:hypothetical protein